MRLAEGKPRTDKMGRQGYGTAIYSWPLFGRYVLFVLTKAW